MTSSTECAGTGQNTLKIIQVGDLLGTPHEHHDCYHGRGSVFGTVAVGNDLHNQWTALAVSCERVAEESDGLPGFLGDDSSMLVLFRLVKRLSCREPI